MPGYSNSESFLAPFTGADPNHILQGQDEDLAVADLGPSRRPARTHDCFCRRFYLVVGKSHLDAHLAHQIHVIFLAPIHFLVSSLPPVALDVRHGQAENPLFAQGLLDGIESEGLNNRDNELHGQAKSGKGGNGLRTHEESGSRAPGLYVSQGRGDYSACPKGCKAEPSVALENVREGPDITSSILILGAYLLGSVPFGWLIARVHGKDLRQIGSGNIGATNVGRALGMAWGLAAFALDFGKGALPVLLALRLAPGWAAPAAGAAAVVGHVWPLYLGFRGGKAVATAAGVFGVLAPWAALASFVVWAVVARTTRFVSLASLLSAVCLPGVLWLTPVAAGVDRRAVLGLSLAVAALVLLRHKGNIRRLLAGTEHRVGGGPV